MPKTKTLTETDSGTRVIISSVDSGCGLRRRLSELGINPGEAVVVLQNIGCGPVLVEVRGAKTALGREASRAVRVREIGAARK